MSLEMKVCDMRKMIKEEMKELKEDVKKGFCEEMEKLRSDIIDQIKCISLEVEELKKENKEMKAEMIEQEKSVQFMSECFEKLKKENEGMAARLDELEKKDGVEESMQLQIDNLELHRRACNLELQGIEEKEKENCKELVTATVAKITPNVKVEDIESAYRVGSKKNQDGSIRNRAILFKLRNRLVRDRIYGNRANLKKISTKENPIYINENLPYNLKQILSAANKARKEKNYKFLWTKNGTVLVRKEEKSPVIAIKSMKDLLNIV